MLNPEIAEVTRGSLVESRHTGAFAVVDAAGKVLRSAGHIAAPIFPRSAIKALQCVPLIDSGAADRFGFTEEQIALACASHNGEPEHVRVARAMLAKSETPETCYECGVDWPMRAETTQELVRAGGIPDQVHNNCSLLQPRHGQLAVHISRKRVFPRLIEFRHGTGFAKLHGQIGQCFRRDPRFAEECRSPVG